MQPKQARLSAKGKGARRSRWQRTARPRPQRVARARRQLAGKWRPWQSRSRPSAPSAPRGPPWWPLAQVWLLLPQAQLGEQRLEAEVGLSHTCSPRTASRRASDMPAHSSVRARVGQGQGTCLCAIQTLHMRRGARRPFGGKPTVAQVAALAGADRLVRSCAEGMDMMGGCGV